MLYVLTINTSQSKPFKDMCGFGLQGPVMDLRCRKVSDNALELIKQFHQFIKSPERIYDIEMGISITAAVIKQIESPLEPLYVELKEALDHVDLVGKALRVNLDSGLLIEDYSTSKRELDSHHRGLDNAFKNLCGLIHTAYHEKIVEMVEKELADHRTLFAEGNYAAGVLDRASIEEKLAAFDDESFIEELRRRTSDSFKNSTYGESYRHDGDPSKILTTVREDVIDISDSGISEEEVDELILKAEDSDIQLRHHDQGKLMMTTQFQIDDWE